VVVRTINEHGSDYNAPLPLPFASPSVCAASVYVKKKRRGDVRTERPLCMGGGASRPQSRTYSHRANPRTPLLYS